MIGADVLFDANSKNEYSPYFAIPTNGFGLIQAFGFAETAEAVISETLGGVTYTSTQSFAPAACVHMALFSDPGLPEFEPCSTGIIDFSKFTGELLIETPVLMHGCPWQISACNNIVLLDLPGQYRLKLNDPNSVGTVYIVSRYFHKEAFKENSLLYFGG